MDVKITPQTLCGTVNAIPSKSFIHRMLICAALNVKPCKIITDTKNLSEDILATADCLSALGIGIKYEEDGILVIPTKNYLKNPTLDCRESASTLRFMLPFATAIENKTNFTGSGSLLERPITELLSVLKKHGVKFSSDTLPFSTKGKLKNGVFEVPGNISSQYISGLMMTLPLLKNSTVSITTKLESAPYVEITKYVMKLFESQPSEVVPEADWSNAAPFYVANFLGSDININGLSFGSVQGDKKIIEYLSFFNTLKNQTFTINLSDTPDLLPVLAVAASAANVKTIFCGAKRLRLKESDRLKSVCNMINALGGNAEETVDGLIIKPSSLVGGTVDSFNDHRIVMAATVAATICTEPVVITNADAINKSYPNFFDEINRLGGKTDAI
ncbi:MAG: 3-phosphoshikimate 1-carboxyvinyltransferase [Ruminococcaceae bacterium]|nr:3-phosphoshikimate 1-carboxyvinyltransferase [Oscillospiraceae bacterium]